MCHEASSQTHLYTLSAFSSGRHQHGQLLRGEVGEGPDGSGHPSDWQGGTAPERRVIRGNALHCEGHVEGQLHWQNISTTIKASDDVQSDNFTLSHDMNKCTSREKWWFYFRAKLECPGSFPPTMPCTSGVRFTEEVLDHGPESLRGEEGGRTQADGDREYRGTTLAPWHLTT